ncbi:MAG TPA: septation protein SepH, partial [Actinomycetota bacterium]|nr:septation protein SepH [Actinomycetota bacterium]
PAGAAAEAAPAREAEGAAAQPPDAARGRIQPRRTRPDIPARSNLSPAEIQTLIRAGRSVRTVAQLAGTSTAWIRWLAEPVEQERMGVVAQALRQRQRRARLGQSAMTLGDAVVQNLRRRGMATPDRIVEEGFSAARDGPRWAVRLTYEHRGRRLNAQWGFDPQSRDLVPLNDLATQLGWAEPAARNGLEPEEQPAPRPRKRRSRASSRNGRASSSRSAAARRSTPRGGARKATSVRSPRGRSATKGSTRSRRRG